MIPALAIADELRAEGANVSFIGTRGRAEAELVPAAGYEISFLSVSGLDRRNPLRAALAAARAVGAVAAAVRLLRQLHPDAVLAAGGYVAGPVGLAAAILRVPLVLAEADSRLGLANRSLARFARRVCLSFPIAGLESTRYIVTGRPVRRDVVAGDRAAARSRLGVDADPPCLLVFGGSLGARSLNHCALEAFAGGTAGDDGPVVLHVAGRRDHGELAARLEQLGGDPRYRLYEYLPSLADPLAACDLVLARSGGSVFELAAAGRPSILVPYPLAAGGHQTQNARWMADAGAAVVLDDSALEPARLAELVRGLLADGGRLAAMSEAARSLARPDAAARVAAELLAAAGERTAGESAGARLAASEPWSGRRIHFVGIGGAGMSGLALVARELGAQVSGCDRADSAYTRMLSEAGIETGLGHSPSHLADADELVVTTAVPHDSPELEAARARGMPIVHRGELLAEVAALRKAIAVSGTHGKTTVAAMTAHALRGCGLDPGYLIGAELGGAGGAPTANAAWGAGDWVVVEADESDRSFLKLSPEIAIVTNVELDHHVTYGSLVELEQAYTAFLARLPEGGAAIVWHHDELRRLVAPGREVVTFDVLNEGDVAAPDLAARSVRATESGVRFELLRSGNPVGEVELPVPGRHNVLNALAALAACERVSCDLEQAARALESFRAAGRRFERKGELGGVRVIDDYAHHPTEVAATLEAARALLPERLIAIFQPHLYSRTLHLHRELGEALAAADVAAVLDVYPARERPEGSLEGVSGKLVADACADHAGGRPVWWLPTLEEAEAVISGQLREGDVVVTLGAGDVDQLAERLVARLNGSRS